jgi:hypothetical protein
MFGSNEATDPTQAEVHMQWGVRIPPQLSSSGVVAFL